MRKQTYNRDFKLAVVRRVAAGEPVGALSRELGVCSRDIYNWLDRYRTGGAAALRADGRPTRLEAAEKHRVVVLDAFSRKAVGWAGGAVQRFQAAALRLTL